MLKFLVNGKGESRASNSITTTELELSIPGVQAEKLLEKIPGITVVANDPFGFYEFGNDIRVRAFNLSKLAITLDGVPMGNNDPRYGTPVGRLIDAENLSSIKVSQGAGDVTTPAYEALGGSLQYFTEDPSKTRSAELSATYGDFDQRRLFARFDTGEIRPGLSAYVSASHFEFTPRGLESVNAKGMGRRLDSKIKFELDKATFRYAFTYNDRDDYDTQVIYWSDFVDLQNGNFRGTGRGWSEFTPYNSSLDSFSYGDYSDMGRHLGPPTYIDSSVGAGEGANINYYNLWKNGRMDYFHRVIADFDISPDLKVKVTPYYQDKRNYGTFGNQTKEGAEQQIRDAYAADPTRKDIWAKMYYNAAGQALDMNGNVVTAFSSAHAVVAPTATPTNYIAGVPGRTGRDEDFGGYRSGIAANAEWSLSNNKLIGGFWYEYDKHDAVRPYYNLSGGSVTGDFLYDQPLYLLYSRHFNTYVYQGWLQDTVKLLDGKLDLIGGVKALKLDRNVHGFLDNSQWKVNKEARRNVSYEDMFLPQLGALYRLNKDTELFFNYSENMAMPPSATLSSPSGFVSGLLGPEYSDNFDLGVRGVFGAFDYTVQAYFIKYTDRILSIPIPVGSSTGLAGQEAYMNVGGVDSKGAEASVDWKSPVKGLTLTGTLAFQETTFQEDLPNGINSSGQQVYLPLKGKDLGNTPFVTANLDARYVWGNFRFNFGGRFFDSVYVNTINTQQLPSYTVYSGAVAYKGAKGSMLENYEVSLNVYNVFDEYFFTAGAYTDTEGAVQADQGRQVSLTISAKF